MTVLHANKVVSCRRSFHQTHRAGHSTVRLRKGHGGCRRCTATCAAAEVDVSIGVKIGLAEGSGQLDLSEKNLYEIPEAVFELTGLEVGLLGSRRERQDCP